MESNLDIFESREEIAGLKESTEDYISLRTTRNIPLLQDILMQLRSKGPDYVVASWISPPFGKIKGYGVYSQEKADHYSQRSKKERWGFPRFGSIYTQDRLERRIEKLRGYLTQNHLVFHYQQPIYLYTNYIILYS